MKAERVWKKKKKKRLHLLSMEMPFIAQVMVGLGVPLAKQDSLPLSPGARTRFLGGTSIQYGAAASSTGYRSRLDN